MARAKRRFKPMGFADILDEAFDLYKSNFVLLVGIAAMTYGPACFLFGAAMTCFPGTSGMGYKPGGLPSSSPDMARIAGASGLFFVALFLMLFAYLIVVGAHTAAVSRRYLGQVTSIGESYRFVMSRFWPLVGAWLLQMLLIGSPVLVVVFIFGVGMGFAMMNKALLAMAVVLLVPIGLAAIAATFFLYVRTAIVEPVIILEGYGCGSSITRSWRLVSEHGWRIFGILLLSTFIVGIMGNIVTMPANFLAQFLSKSGNMAIASAINGCAQAVVQTTLAPIVSIITVLLYYDLRIRKEGFDLQMLAQELGAQVPGSLAASETQTETTAVLRCAHCGYPIHEAADGTACPTCRSPHHTSCWTEHRGCASPECASAANVAGPTA